MSTPFHEIKFEFIPMLISSNDNGFVGAAHPAIPTLNLSNLETPHL